MATATAWPCELEQLAEKWSPKTPPRKRASDYEASVHKPQIQQGRSYAELLGERQLRQMKTVLVSYVEVAETLEQKFHRLAYEWEKETINISSVDALTQHPAYREILRMAWEIVPYLLEDLVAKRSYWFTALNEITGLRPFDPRQAGNFEKMREAWIKWGRDKRLI